MSSPKFGPVRVLRLRVKDKHAVWLGDLAREVNTVFNAERWLSLWDRYGLGNVELRAGNFSKDSRGRWYLSVCVPDARQHADPRNKPSAGAILDRSVPSVWIDLGLKSIAAFSDATMPPVEAERFYRDLEPALARAQRARHRHRCRAIHAKIANRRRDFLHELSTQVVEAHGAIFLGNINASALAKGQSRYAMRDGARFEPCCSINALTQACGLRRSMKGFPPRPAARVTAAPAPRAGKVLE